MRSARLLVLVLCVAVLTAAMAWPASKKKKKEEPTQVLELPKDPPQAVIADASRLVFHLSPLSDKGLLSQQVRDGVKALLRQVRGAQVAKLRAFVAGSGDVRRVQAVVSEEFTERRLSIPALTVVQVGELPMEGAQVILESISVDKKTTTPHGVAIVSGQPGAAKDAAARLSRALQTGSLSSDALRQATCYLDSLDFLDGLRQQFAAAFPKAPVTYVQLRRDSSGEFVECEGIAALTTAPPKSPSFLGSRPKQRSQLALVGPVRIALTGAQLAFGRGENDVRLSIERLGKALESVGGTWKTVASMNMYVLVRPMIETSGRQRMALLDAETPPASTALQFEGLPSLDALMSLDAVAVVDR